MSKKAFRIDRIGYGSEIKLDIVKKYASAYSTIMAKQSSIGRHIYIDAFAGAGQHISKATGDFVQGSPLKALAIRRLSRNCTNRSRWRARAGEAAEYHRPDDKRVTVHQGDCNDDLLLRDVFPATRRYAIIAGRFACLIRTLSVNWGSFERPLT